MASHLREVERVPVLEHARRVAAAHAREVLRERGGVPDAVRIVGRAGGAAPGALVDVAVGGAVLDVRDVQAEVDRRVLGGVPAALQLQLVDVGLHVAVAERRARHQLAFRARGADDAHHRKVVREVDRGGAALERGGAQVGVGAVGAVLARRGVGRVGVGLEPQGGAGLPGQVQAQRAQRRLDDEPVAAHGDVLEAGAAANRRVWVREVEGLAIEFGPRHRAVGPAADRRAEVEPRRQVAALGVHDVLRERVVQRAGERVRRLPLQRQLAVGALALDAVDRVVDVLRHLVQVGRARAVGDVLRAGRARLRDPPQVVSAPGTCASRWWRAWL